MQFPGPLVRDVEIYDIAWAPHMGRRYHLIAVACKDKKVRVCKISLKGDKPTVQMSELEHPNGAVWRISWNMTGTMLASSGDDGCVRLWKAGPGGKWEQGMLLAPPAMNAK